MADIAAQGLPVPNVRTPEQQHGSAPHRHAGPKMGLLLVPIVLFIAIVVARWVLETSPTTQSLPDRLAPPVWLGGRWDHPLGTDSLGRDVSARVVQGAGASLRFSLIATSLAAFTGLSLGIVAGISRGWLDRAIMQIADLTLSIPAIVVGIVLTATIGQNGRNLIVILALQGWIAYTRVVRLQVRQLATSDFVDAARSLGASRQHIAITHILPHLVPTALLLIGQQVGGMMLWESSLTYLGIGASPDTITLGSIVRDGQEQLFTAWWISFAAGSVLAIGIIGFGFFGDWIRLAFDRRVHLDSDDILTEA